MKLNYLIQIILLYTIFFFNCLQDIQAQNDIEIPKEDNYLLKNGISKANILNAHHFGMFISKINNNFKLYPTKKTTLRLNVSSSNLWLPKLKAFLPRSPVAKERIKQIIWHKKLYHLTEQEKTTAKIMEIEVDAVIKSIKADFDFKISNKSELSFSVRSYLITNGKIPFSLFTSDKVIELFHSKIQGNEDPFGRKYYGLDKAHIKYLDRNDNTLELYNGDFIVTGIESNYYYYPKLPFNRTNIFMNFGLHLGINIHKYNSATDVGVSANVIKVISLKRENEIMLGLGSNILRKNLFNFKQGIDLSNNNYLFNYEIHLEYSKETSSHTHYAFGVNYSFQSRFNDKTELDYMGLEGDWEPIPNTWRDGFYTLYEPLKYISLICTYSKKNHEYSFYFKEDLFLNNAPDLETGISIKFKIQ